MKGKVARVTDKGFGFITADNKDYFFHKSGCIDEFDALRPGDDVTFDSEKGPKGPRAVNVRLDSGRGYSD